MGLTTLQDAPDKATNLNPAATTAVIHQPATMTKLIATTVTTVLPQSTPTVKQADKYPVLLQKLKLQHVAAASHQRLCSLSPLAPLRAAAQWRLPHLLVGLLQLTCRSSHDRLSCQCLSPMSYLGNKRLVSSGFWLTIWPRWLGNAEETEALSSMLLGTMLKA